MRKGWVAIGVILLSAIFLAVALLPDPDQKSDSMAIAAETGADKVQLLYFHRTERCVTCNNVEQYARDTLDTYFKNELDSGIISINSIDYQKDKETAKKYTVKMQGLKMEITKNGETSVKDIPEVWTYAKDKTAYMKFLKSIIDKELGR
jgi:hypothetical protein